MIKYSVIIPHKDCHFLLSRCLDSIPNREDIEVIVVDDNSKDISSVQSLEQVCQHVNKKFLYTNGNKGAGYARNKGLEVVSGKWLLFADADDYFSKDAFECFDKYSESDADIIVFKHCSVYSDTGVETVRSDSRNTYIDAYLTEQNKLNEARLRYCNDVPWAKMVSKSMVDENHIYFDEVPASNDTMFSLMAGYYAKTIKADIHVVYCCTVRQGSITKTKSIDRYFSDHCVALRKNKFVREIGHPECQEVILSRLFIVLKNFGFAEFLRFMKEVKHYKGRLFFGLAKKLGIK